VRDRVASFFSFADLILADRLAPGPAPGPARGSADLDLGAWKPALE
jgi:hypothetical protein